MDFRLLRTPTANGGDNDVTSTTIYSGVEVASPWPPPIPDGADFLPIGKGFSAFDAVEITQAFEVVMLQAAYNKMMFFVLNAPGEVSGFGRVERRGRVFVVTDIFLVDQYNTEDSSVITEDTMYRLNRRLHKHGLSMAGWDCWWHSHNNFGVGFSPIDLKAIEELHMQRPVISIVTNKRLDLRCRMDFYEPARYCVDHLTVKTAPEIAPEHEAELRAQMQQMSKMRRSR